MPTIRPKVNFFDTERGSEIEAELWSLDEDSNFITEASYSPDTRLYPDNVVSFVQKHKSYITAHPDIDPAAYVSNLRLKTRIRR